MYDVIWFNCSRAWSLVPKSCDVDPDPQAPLVRVNSMQDWLIDLKLYIFVQLSTFWIILLVYLYSANGFFYIEKCFYLGSLSVISIGKQGGLLSQVALHVMPSSKVCLLMDSIPRLMSWSRNCPHCITIWLRFSSGVTFDDEMIFEETSLALGSLKPLCKRSFVQPQEW